MELELFSQLNTELSILLTGWITIVFGLLIKDLLTNFVYGIMFYLDKNFNEGDIIYFNNQKYTIIKNGLLSSVFQNEETKRWAYVRNSKIHNLILEKRINESE